MRALFRASSESCGQHCSSFSDSGRQIMAVTVLEAALATAGHALSPCACAAAAAAAASLPGAGKEKVRSAAGPATWVAGLGPADDGPWTDLACTESGMEYKFPVLAETSANS